MTDGEEEFTEKDLKKCTAMEAHVYRLLHGMPYGPSTLEVCAQIFGLTRERIRQIEEMTFTDFRRRRKFKVQRDRLRSFL